MTLKNIVAWTNLVQAIKPITVSITNFMYIYYYSIYTLLRNITTPCIFLTIALIYASWIDDCGFKTLRWIDLSSLPFPLEETFGDWCVSCNDTRSFALQMITVKLKFYDLRDLIYIFNVSNNLLHISLKVL